MELYVELEERIINAAGFKLAAELAVDKEDPMGQAEEQGLESLLEP